MEPIKVNIFIETTPEHYTTDCDISMTLSCKLSADSWKRDLLISLVNDFEGWEFRNINKLNDSDLERK